ncbi:MAG: tetratricopeptide repeat protein, partial [Terriglobales bacterium]
MTTMIRKSIPLLFALLLAALPSSAQSTKDRLIRLQTQVETLQQQMTAMQRSIDERMGVMRNLVEQSTDNVNKMASTLTRLEKTLTTQSTEAGEKVDQVSQQVQSLQDSVDELKTRVARLSQQLEDLQAARSNIGEAAPVPDAAAAPPADVLYKNALADYNA